MDIRGGILRDGCKFVSGMLDILIKRRSELVSKVNVFFFLVCDGVS